MLMVELDSFDVRILEALQKQGDLTMAELADRVFLSHSQCSRRVKHLRDTGLIQRFAAILDPRALGLGLKVYITVTLKQHSQVASEFHMLVTNAPEILECCMVTGDGDFLLKAYVRDLQHLRDLLGQLSGVEIVGTLKSVIVIDDVKNTSALPVYATTRSA
jgi:Lrp/AsnC family leucine-responsive transcriptional regulator